MTGYISLISSCRDSHIHGLSIAGAANLQTDDELLEAYNLIENQAGTGHPLSVYKDQLTKGMILKFFKCYASTRDNQIPINEIIDEMRKVNEQK